MKGKTEIYLAKTQAHVLRNWKAYGIGVIVLLLWLNRDKIAAALGFEITPKGLPNEDKNAAAAYAQNTGTVRQLQEDGTTTQKEIVFSNAVQDFSWRIKNWYESIAWWSSDQTERCNIAKKILAMSDDDIIIQNQHYFQTYSKTIYQTMLGVSSDPCGYFGVTDYDKALEKLERVTAKQS